MTSKSFDKFIAGFIGNALTKKKIVRQNFDQSFVIHQIHHIVHRQIFMLCIYGMVCACKSYESCAYFNLPFGNMNLESHDPAVDISDKTALRIAVQSVLNSKYGMLFTI